MQDAKNRHLGTTIQLCRAISSQLRHVLTIGKKLLSSNISSRCPHNMVNFGPLAAEIGPVVWGTPANFNSFHVLAALQHGSQVVGVSQTLRRWTGGATYVRQGDHHVRHWPHSSLRLMFTQKCDKALHIKKVLRICKILPTDFLSCNYHILLQFIIFGCNLVISFFWIAHNTHSGDLIQIIQQLHCTVADSWWHSTAYVCWCKVLFIWQLLDMCMLNHCLEWYNSVSSCQRTYTTTDRVLTQLLHDILPDGGTYPTLFCRLLAVTRETKVTLSNRSKPEK